MSKLKCAVIGVGYLGKFHAQKYAALPNAELVAVCDTNQDTCNEIASQYGVAAVYDYHELIGKVDAVSIAVPTTMHSPIAKTMLENNVHVLLEKPITRTVAEAEELIRIADKNELILQVGHLERFNCVLLEASKHLHKPKFIESTRRSPFRPRNTDVNVVLDLMIHDIDLIHFVVQSPIKQIHANGVKVLSQHIDMANAHIQFENGCVANVTASRVSFNTNRIMRIFQQDGYLTLDLNNKKFSTHRKGSNEMVPGIPEIIHEEQAFDQEDVLKEEIAAFISAIQTNSIPLVTGVDGKNALETAIEITRIVNEQNSDSLLEELQ